MNRRLIRVVAMVIGLVRKEDRFDLGAVQGDDPALGVGVDAVLVVGLEVQLGSVAELLLKRNAAFLEGIESRPLPPRSPAA